MKLPGQTKYSNLVLKRGVTDDRQLWQWHQDTADGRLERKHGSIVLRDRAGKEKARWNFFDAWITKWTGPDFKAEASDLAIETLELAHERVERA